MTYIIFRTNFRAYLLVINKYHFPDIRLYVMTYRLIGSSATLILKNFLVSVKVAPYECVIRTGQP